MTKHAAIRLASVAWLVAIVLAWWYAATNVLLAITAVNVLDLAIETRLRHTPTTPGALWSSAPSTAGAGGGARGGASFHDHSWMAGKR